MFGLARVERGEAAPIALMMMRRLLSRLRWILVILAVLSAAMWIRSAFRADLYGWDRSDGHHVIVSYRGGVDFMRIWCVPEGERYACGYMTGDAKEVHGGRPLGSILVPLRYYRTPSDSRGTPPRMVETTCIPYWFLTLATLIWPAAFFARKMFHRRVLHARSLAGLCLICGYDVRASRDRCPECGTELAQAGKRVCAKQPAGPEPR